jgi:hypothetical protein
MCQRIATARAMVKLANQKSKVYVIQALLKVRIILFLQGNIICLVTLPVYLQICDNRHLFEKH